MLNQEQTEKLILNGKIIFCFDIDDTILKMIDLKTYLPYKKRIEYINKLYDNGNYIYLYTARRKYGTKKFLKSVGLKYHEIIFGKPKAHIYIDDCGINNRYWKNKELYNEIYRKRGNSIYRKVKKTK